MRCILLSDCRPAAFGAPWWTYFDRFEATAQERLRTHGDPVLAAADGYSHAKVGAATAALALFAVGGRAPAWVTAVTLTLVLTALVVWEVITERPAYGARA